jgi:hypothetical protein
MEPQATGRSDRGRPARIASQRPAVRHPTRNDDVQGDRFHALRVGEAGGGLTRKKDTFSP